MTFLPNTCEMKTETQNGSKKQRQPYLQVSWWGRSLCPEGPPPRWRCSSCRASRGRNGPPHRWRWVSPPGGWAQPSGRSRQLPAWLTCPPESQQTWSWPLWLAPQTCWCPVFIRVRGLMLLKAVKFVFSSLTSGAQRFHSFPTPQTSSPISCSQLFCSPPCACWLKKRGPDSSALDSPSLSLPPRLPLVSRASQRWGKKQDVRVILLMFNNRKTLSELLNVKNPGLSDVCHSSLYSAPAPSISGAVCQGTPWQGGIGEYFL